MLNSKKWVVVNIAHKTFMKHPRGEWTRIWKKAYCWHYKKDASDEGRSEAYCVFRLEDALAKMGIKEY